MKILYEIKFTAQNSAVEGFSGSAAIPFEHYVEEHLGIYETYETTCALSCDCDDGRHDGVHKAGNRLRNVFLELFVAFQQLRGIAIVHAE